MLNASNAVENQRVSICRLSDENFTLIKKALDIAWDAAATKNITPLANAIDELSTQLRKGKEIWLIES
jgi:hypothetical protein